MFLISLEPSGGGVDLEAEPSGGGFNQTLSLNDADDDVEKSGEA